VLKPSGQNATRADVRRLEARLAASEDLLASLPLVAVTVRPNVETSAR
jgi:hypothetical protein